MSEDFSRDFSKMSREGLVSFCRELYSRNGISAFSYPALNSIPKLYSNLYIHGLSQKALLKEMGIELEYKKYQLTQPRKYGSGFRLRWSWDLVIEKTIEIKNAEGHLPPALWFQKNGHASIIQALYNSGHTWADLREAVGDFSGSNFVESRNGLRWLSHAEASLSNFLYARGIEHKKGERYSQHYSEFSGARYAIFDMHFRGENGSWFDVEIWGDKPNGHNEKKYARIRYAKEKFNSTNLNFIGIHFADCYEEEKLSDILCSSLGRIVPFKFDKPTDHQIYSTHWSNADELLVFCKALALKMPNGEFPAEDWLRKRGKWADREGDAYNTLSVYIKIWLGGIRNLRKLIGQSEVSTQQWDRNSALSAYKEFYEKYELTPAQVINNYRRKFDVSVSTDVAAYAACLSSAILKYVGGSSKAKSLLGIKIQRQTKWSRDKVIFSVKQICDEYELSPNQLLRKSSKGDIFLSLEKVKMLKQLINAITRFPGGLDGVYAELGIRPQNHQKI